MRVPRNRQNRFLQPLDEVLGTQANVRLLRVLVLRRTSLTAGELARSAALGRTWIYPALRQLERAGIVEFVGAGAQRLVQLRDRHPLSRILKELFRSESRRFETLTVALRDLLADLHRLMSAWIDEPTDDAQSSETLSLYVVAHPEELGPLRTISTHTSPKSNANTISISRSRNHAQRTRDTAHNGLSEPQRRRVDRWSSASRAHRPVTARRP